MQDLRNEPAGIYLRISDDREGRELGVERQEEDCRRLAKQLGVKIVDIYCDNDVSASTRSKKPRPDYQRLLTDTRTGRIKVVLSYTTSRLTRRMREHEDLIDLALDYGARFHYVSSPSFDLNTSAGREVARHLAARDAAEAEDIQERVLRAKLQAAMKGEYNGGPRAYGYGKKIGVHPSTGKDVLDHNALVEEEVAILQECKERVLAGERQMVIVKSLNERGIPTAKSYQWTVGKLKRTLLLKRYVIFDSDDPQHRGTREHKGAEYQAVWPGIFTRTEHEMLATIFAETPTPVWSNNGIRARRYLLSGFTFCGNCGGVMRGQGKTYGDQYVRRYACKKYDAHMVQVGCHQVFRIADPVEKLVSDAVLLRFDTPEVAQALAPAENRERAHELAQQVVQLQRRRQQLAEEHALTPYEDYHLMLATIKGKMEAAQSELARLQTTKARKALLPTDGNLRAVWEGASLEWRASVIKLVVKRVVIHPGRSGFLIWEGWRFNPDLVKVEWVY